MSLIQEALRRKEDDELGSSAIPPKQIPPVLTIPQPEKKNSRVWLVLAGSLAVVLGLIIAALALLVFSAKYLVGTGEESPAAVSAEVTPVPAAPSPESVASVEEVLSDPLEEAEGEAAVPEPATELRPAVVRPAEPEPPVRAAAEPRREVKRPSSRPIQRRLRRPEPQPEPRRPEKITPEDVETVSVIVTDSFEWPKLNLLGVMARSDPKRGSAILNNTVVAVGEQIEGARLLTVERNGVLLEYSGETQFVRVGQSTF